MCCSLWSSDDITSPFPRRHSSRTHRPPRLTALFDRHCLDSYEFTSRNYPGRRRAAGLNSPKPLVPRHVHFPETLKETRVYLRIHNSDTARLVKYLFLTAESFWDNWANTSAAYGGEAADWRAIHPSEQSSHGRVFLLVLEEVLLAFAG